MMTLPKKGRARYILIDAGYRRYIWRLVAPNGIVLAERVCQSRMKREESIKAFRSAAATSLVEGSTAWRIGK